MDSLTKARDICGTYPVGIDAPGVSALAMTHAISRRCSSVPFAVWPVSDVVDIGQCAAPMLYTVIIDGLSEFEEPFRRTSALSHGQAVSRDVELFLERDFYFTQQSIPQATCFSYGLLLITRRGLFKKCTTLTPFG